MKTFTALFTGVGLILAFVNVSANDSILHDYNAKDVTVVDAYTLRGSKNFLTDYQPTNGDGSINVVIEIPAGTAAKWEVAKSSGEIEWEFKKGKPRVVKYLPYPGNYGMIPRTLLSKEAGGDGDPLDVIVLGPAVPRGSVVKARVIGVLNLLDGGEQDDKILAVLEGTPLAEVATVKELDAKFPGVSTIVSTWFVSYKGPGELESEGFDGPEKAMQIVTTAMGAYK